MWTKGILVLLAMSHIMNKSFNKHLWSASFVLGSVVIARDRWASGRQYSQEFSVSRKIEIYIYNYKIIL